GPPAPSRSSTSSRSAAFTIAPAKTTCETYGATTRPRPNCSISSSVSIGPPKPPRSSGAPIASQPSSPNVFQWSAPACSPPANRATLSLMRSCSGERVKSMMLFQSLQLEDALGDDVLLDLVGAGVDRRL